MKKFKTLITTATFFAATVASQLAMATPALNAAGSSVANEAGKAVIYVYQDEYSIEKLGISLEIDSEFVGSLRENTFVKKVVEPGEYTLLSRSENLPELTITANANEVYYVRKDIEMGKYEERTSLDVVDAATAQKAISMSNQINM